MSLCWISLMVFNLAKMRFLVQVRLGMIRLASAMAYSAANKICTDKIAAETKQPVRIVNGCNLVGPPRLYRGVFRIALAQPVNF